MEPTSNLGRFGRLLLVLSGIALLALGIFFTARQQIPWNLKPATSVITGFVCEDPDAEVGGYTLTLVRYELNGTQYESIPLHQYEASWQIGNEVRILADKHHPEDIKTPTMIYGGWLMMLASIPFLVIGPYTILTARRKSNRTPEEIAEDEERTPVGKMKYKVSSIVIPLSTGLPLTAMALIFYLLEGRSVLALLLLLLGVIASLVGIRSAVMFIVMTVSHIRSRHPKT